MELPLGKISDSQVLNKLTDETKNRYVVTAEDQELSRSKEVSQVGEAQQKAKPSEAPYENLEIERQDGGIDLSSNNLGAPNDQKSITSNEPSLDRGATHRAESPR